MHETQQAPVQRQTITVKEAAELLGVSQTTVYAMVRQGQIPAVRVRSRIFFTRLALEEWLRSGGVTA